MMEIVFLCNNHYHLSLAYCVAKRYKGSCDLVLLGGFPELAASDFARSGVWRNVTSFFCGTDWRSIATMSNSLVSLLRNQASAISYDATFYFVDKYFLNQIFLESVEANRMFLVEEGIGLYNGGKASLSSYIKGALPVFLKTMHCLKMSSCEQGANRYNDGLICRFPDLVPSSKSDRKTSVKYDYPFGQEDLADLAGFSAGNAAVQTQAPCMLFVGSGIEITECGWLSKEEEQRQLMELFKVFERRGVCCYVKPHPRESKGKYRSISPSVIELDTSATIEVTSYLLQPKYAVSYMSTGLLNLAEPEKKLYLYEWIDGDFPNKSTLKKIEGFFESIAAPKGIQPLENELDKGERGGLSSRTGCTAVDAILSVL